ncbi:MAG: DUF115 domain-containing protein [Firmicutes bacterium]|nr:DUF115 domain-containing protein [Bacillota bacterium]
MTKENIESNRLIRLCLYPFINIKRTINKKRYKYTSDAEFIRGLKDSHEGERCFIIGNGPSLKIEDLDLLKDEFCFAFNRIFQVFDKTEWRPDIYMCVDKNVFKDSCNDLYDFEFPILLTSEVKGMGGLDKKKNVVFVENYVPFLINRYKRTKDIPFSTDASVCMYGGATVTYTALQLAVYMGFKSIYLLGIDNSYSHTVDSKGRISVDNKVRNYFDGLKTMPYTLQAIETVNAAYESAAKFAGENGLKIINATRGGNLKNFPRASLEDVL